MFQFNGEWRRSTVTVNGAGYLKIHYNVAMSTAIITELISASKRAPFEYWSNPACTSESDNSNATGLFSVAVALGPS